MARAMVSAETSVSSTSSACSRAGLRFVSPRSRSCMVNTNVCWASFRSSGTVRAFASAVSLVEAPMY